MPCAIRKSTGDGDGDALEGEGGGGGGCQKGMSRVVVTAVTSGLKSGWEATSGGCRAGRHPRGFR